MKEDCKFYLSFYLFYYILIIVVHFLILKNLFVAHLICPISFDEINEAWSSEIGKLIMDRIPLTDVIWKNSTTQTNQVISRLPVRFVPSSSSLFKDTNHPFRWFLAPYVSLYFVSAKNLEEYKAIRSLIATWVELQTQSNGNNKSFWLLVYVVHRDQTPESIREVYSTISNDFLAEKPFDRTVCFQAFGSSETPPQSRLNLSFNDLFAKMRLAISFTFQHRVMIYEREIQRLDTAAGTTAYSFRQAYLVKESLALMFQMMQQPENALLQYIEIERALSLSPRAAYFDTDWPFVNYNSTQSETNRQSSKPPTNNRSSSSAAAAAEGNASSSGIASEYQLKEPLVSKSIGNEVDPTSINVASPREKQRDPWSEVCRQGDEFLSYSINQMRMRVLKTRTSTLELHKYIFARQMFFLLLLSPIRLQDYVEKGCYFVRYMFDQLSKKVLFKHNKSFNQADDSSAEGVDLIFLQARWQSNSDINVADISPLLLSIRRKQVDLWFICASVRLIKSFSLIINAPSTKSLVSTKDNDADTTHPGSPQLSVMSHSLLNDVSGLSLSECYRQLSDLSALVCQRASLLCAPLIQNSQLPQPLIASVLSIEFSRQFEKSALDSNQQFTRFPFRHNSFERGRLLSGLISAQFTGWYDGCSEGSLLEFYTKSRAAPLALSRSESALKLSDEQPPILSRSTELLSDDGATRTVTVFGSKDKRKQDFKSLRKFSQLELSEVIIILNNILIHDTL